MQSTTSAVIGCDKNAFALCIHGGFKTCVEGCVVCCVKPRITVGSSYHAAYEFRRHRRFLFLG